MTPVPRTMPFGPLDVAYDEQVLEPRPWTLAQAEWAAELVGRQGEEPLLELCAGVGQIGLAAAALTGRRVVLVDASEHACAFARRNAHAAGLAERVDVRPGDLEGVLAADEVFALVLADPPYIPSQHTATFPDDPVTAIDGGADGLDLARRCLEVGARHLEPGGSLLLQLRDLAQAGVLAEEVGQQDAPRLAVAELREVPGGGALLHLRRTEVS